MQGVHAGSVSGWVLAILGAFATGFENGLLVTVGYASQWGAKAPYKIKDWVAPLVVFGACAVAFGLIHPPAEFPPSQQWIMDYAKWSVAALGVASLSGHTGGAPKTNSL